MVYFHSTSKELLKIRIVGEFSHSDTERIALLLEGSFKVGLVKRIIFQIETDLPKNQMDLLGNFSKRLPYDHRIDIKYPFSVS